MAYDNSMWKTIGKMQEKAIKTTEQLVNRKRRWPLYRQKATDYWLLNNSFNCSHSESFFSEISICN